MDDLIKYGIMLGGFGLLAYLLLQKQQEQATKYYYRTEEGNVIVTTEPHPELEPIDYGEITSMFTSNAECQAAARAAGYDDGGCLWPSEAPSDYPNLGPCLIEGSRHCGNEGQCNCYGWNYVGFPGESYEPVEEGNGEYGPEGGLPNCETIPNPRSQLDCNIGWCPPGYRCIYMPPRSEMPSIPGKCVCRSMTT